MKRDGYLYPRIHDYENLCVAFHKAAKGKHQRPEVVAFRENFEENIRRLRNQIEMTMPDIGHYRYFKVYDPKPRDICAADFPERVLHHAVMNVCEPFLEKKFIYDSYACRKGKGNLKALDRAMCFAGTYPVYLKMDVRKYFDSIDHRILMFHLTRCFKDKALLDLFDKVFDTYHLAPGKGLPIGNLISQHMANLYLNVFDHWIKEVLGVRGYVRYMDDMIVFGHDKSLLKTWLVSIRHFLKEHLSLELKPNVQINTCRNGIPFLGFRVFNGFLRLSPASRKRLFAKYRAYERKWKNGTWSMDELVRHMEPLLEFSRHARTWALRSDMLLRYGIIGQSRRAGSRPPSLAGESPPYNISAFIENDRCGVRP